MKFALKNISDGSLILSDTKPIWDGEYWETPACRYADPTGNGYIVTAIAVSPMEFKLLFTPQERVAIKAAAAADPIIGDFYGIVDDLRLTLVDLDLKSTKDGIAYLQSKGLLTVARAAAILTGEMA